MESLTSNYVHDKDHIFTVLKSDKYSKQFSRQKKKSDVIIIEIKDFNDDILSVGSDFWVALVKDRLPLKPD